MWAGDVIKHPSLSATISSVWWGLSLISEQNMLDNSFYIYSIPILTEYFRRLGVNRGSLEGLFFAKTTITLFLVILQVYLMPTLQVHVGFLIKHHFGWEKCRSVSFRPLPLSHHSFWYLCFCKYPRIVFTCCLSFLATSSTATFPIFWNKYSEYYFCSPENKKKTLN